jgi:hypothetical protein
VVCGSWESEIVGSWDCVRILVYFGKNQTIRRPFKFSLLYVSIVADEIKLSCCMVDSKEGVLEGHLIAR